MNDMMKRLLSFTLALVMVFGMMPAEALASELDNTEPTVTPTEAPTEVVTEAPATEHSHAHEGAVTTAATCEAEGVMTYTCSCGDTYTKEIAALGHTYVDGFCACGAEDPDWTPADGGTDGDVPEETTEAPAHTHAHEGAVTTEATCTEDGVKTFTCSCGDSYTEAIAATGHAYEDGVCGVCGAADPDYEEKPELSGETRKIYYYNVESWDEVWAAWSFDEDGFDDVAHPGEELSSNTELEDVYVIKVPVEADEVLFSDGIEVTEELLEQERLAGVSVTHEIEVRLAEDRYYDLYQNGAWANYAQTVKALEETEPETEAPAEHTCSYEGTVTKEATCEEAGEMIYACTCGESNTEVMPALGHDYAEGKCTRCGAADPVAEVQAMIEALPTSFATQAEVDNFWDVTAAELDAAIEALTAEQQEQLDTARYDAAIDAAAAFANPEFNDWSSWESAISGTDLEILDGQVMESELAGHVNGSNAATRYSIDGGSNTTLTWNGLWQSDDEIDLTAHHGKIISFQKYSSWKWNDADTYTIKVYHNVTATLAADSDANATGGGVTATGKVYHNEETTVAVTDVDGYKAELYNGTALVTTLSDTAGWTFTIEKATESVAYTVKYVSEAATEYNATVVIDPTSGEYGTASLNKDKGIAGDKLELTVTPAADTASTKYTYSVTVDNGAYNAETGKVTIDGTGEVVVTVTFAKNEIKTTASGTVGFNGYYQDATKSGYPLDTLKSNILTALGVQFNGALVSANDVTIQYFPYYTTAMSGSGYSDEDGLQNLNGTRSDLSIFGVGWTFSEFGQRGYNDGAEFTDTNEKVRIKHTESGLYVDVEITLTESRSAATIVANPDLDTNKKYNTTAELGNEVVIVKDGEGNVIDDSNATISVTSNEDGQYTVQAQVEAAGATWLPSVVTTLGPYTFTYNQYKVTFKDAVDFGGTVLYEDTLNNESTPVYNGTTTVGNLSTIHDTAEWDYTFDGWTPDISALNGADATYTATYTQTKKTYTVTFKDYDGSSIGEPQSVEYGSAATAPAATQEYKTNDKVYTFKGWDVAFDNITDNLEVKAQYNEDTRYYTVTFKNYNGDVLGTSTVEYEQSATVPANPTREPDKDEAGNVTTVYTFSGWDTDFSKITADGIEVTAQYTSAPKQYTITWVIKGEPSTETKDYGYQITHDDLAGYETADAVYTFKGWKVGNSDTAINGDTLPTLTGDVTITAVFSSNPVYQVKIDLADGSTVSGTPVENGDTFEIPDEPTKDGYRFDGWDIAPAAEIVDGKITITANTTITAKWVKTYSYSYVTEHGTAPAGATVDVNTVITVADLLKQNDLTDGIMMTGWYIGETLVSGNYTITGDVTFTAKWEADADNDDIVDGSAEDPYWTIKIQNVDGSYTEQTNVLNGESYAAPDAIDKDNAIFVKWIKTVEGTTVTFTADWNTNDANNNNVDDTSETASITVNVTGNGAVALTAAEGATLTKNEDGTYTLLFDSRGGYDATKVVTVTATPNDTNANDGNVDYVISAPERVTVAAGENTTVTVEFGTHTLGANNGAFTMNGYYEAWANMNEIIKTLKSDVLNAAGLNGANASNYTVNMKYTLGTLNLDDLGGWNVLGNGAFFTAIELPESGRQFVITDNTTGVSKTVTMAITDSRSSAGLEDYTETEAQAKEYESQDDLTDYVTELANGATVNPNGVTVAISTNSTWPSVAGVPTQMVYTVKYADSAEWIGDEATITVYAKAKHNNCTIVADDALKAGGSLTVSGTVNNDGTTVPGNSTVTITVSPINGKYVESITVMNGENAVAISEIAHDNRKATVTFTTDGSVKADQYVVSAEIKDNYLTLKADQTIVYCVDDKDHTYDLQKLVFEAIYGGSSAPMTKDNVTLEFKYGHIVVDLWADVSKDPAINLNGISHKFGESGSETIKLTYSDAKHGSFEQTVNLNVFDSCYNVEVDVQTITNGAEATIKQQFSENTRKYLGVEYFKAGTDLTVTLTPDGDILGVLGQLYNGTFQESMAYIKDVRVYERGAQEPISGIEVVRGQGKLDLGSILQGVNPMLFNASVTFTLENDKDYFVVVEYGIMKLEKQNAEVTLPMYQGGEKYDAEVPTAQEIVDAVLGKEYAANFLATYGGAFTVEFSTDLASYKWTAVSDEALLALNDGAKIKVRITWKPLDGDKTYYPVAQTADLTLVDGRTPTSVAGKELAEGEQVNFSSEAVLVTELKEKLGLGIMADDEALDVDYAVTYTIKEVKENVESTDETTGETVTTEVIKLYADVTVTYDGSADYKPSSKTFTNVPVANRPDDATIKITVENASAVVTNNDGKTQTMDSETGIYTVIGNGTFNIELTPAEGYAIESVSVNGDKIPVKVIVDEAAAAAVETGVLSYSKQKATFSLFLTEKEHYEIVVETVPSVWELEDEPTIDFATGVTKPDNSDIVEAITSKPTDIDFEKVELEYLARAEGDVTVTLPDIDLGFTVIELGTFDIDLGELWLNPEESVDMVSEDQLDMIIDKLVDDVITKVSLGELSATNALPYIQNYIKNLPLGIHAFGAGGDGSTETIRFSYEDDKYLLAEVKTDVTIHDYRTPTEIVANDCEVTFGYSLDQLVAASGAYVAADGAAVSGLKIETNGLYKHVKTEAQEITLFFAGDATYQPSKATIKVTVKKAACDIDYDSQRITYGDAYDFALHVSPTVMPDGTEPEIDRIEFMIGLDMHKLLDVDFEDKDIGIDQAIGYIQLRLPESIRELPLVGQYLQGEFTLGEFTDLINGLSGALGIDENSMGILNQVLGAITGVTDNMDIKVIIKDEDFKPKNIGVYIAGAVTIDADFETAYTADYLLITPNTIEAQLAWDYTDENGIMTLPAYNEIYKELMGAHVVENEVMTGDTLATANDHIKYLILGINNETSEFLYTDVYGNIKANIWTSNDAISDNGAYVQIAYMLNWGNEIYYAMPIVRSFLIVPALYDVQLVGATGEPNDELLKTFNNEQQGFSVIVKDNKGNVIYSDHYQNVVELRENAQLVVNYVGVQTNGQPYNSNEKPVHAGVYAATAVYMEFNDGQMLDISNLDVEDLYELFDLADIGADMGLLVIEPAESTINVEDKIVAWDGTHYKFSDQVLATSVAAENLNPDKTIISAGINTDGDFSENGWAAVGGTVNVDFPRWIDELIAQYAPSVVEGISVKEFSDKLVSKLPSIAGKLEELGATNEMLHSLTNAVTSVAGALENVPENVKLSFNDDAYASSVGAYVIIGIVTDSDHIPSVDAGLLVIAPDVNPVELKWNYEDEDNIWTRELLKFVDLKATAYSAVTGERNEAATDMITHKFIGIDKKGNLIVKDTRNADELPNGAYFELAYIKLDVDGAMTISNLIAREILLVPGTVEVTFVDAPENNIWNHTFDNTPKAVEVVVTNNGKVVEPKAGELTVTYTGIQTNGKIYRSTEAPVHAGAYTVAAEYVEYTAGGSLANIGAAAGFITIAPAEATINVADSMIVDFQSGKSYDLEETMVTVGSAVPNLKPDTTIISAQINTDGDFSENGWAAVNGNVNVDFPRWVDELLAEQVPGVKDGITAAELKEKLTAKLPGILSKLEDLGATNEIINSLNNLVGNLNKVLAQIPDNMTLTFKDDVVVSSVGAYAVAAIVTDSDHIPAADAGVLVILPEVDVVDLKWNHEDANNIWTRELLEEFDLWAKAYDKESGELDAGATAVIHYQFIGMDKNGSLLVIDTDNANDLPNGVYTELAYIELEIDGHMYISDLIARTVIIVPNAAEVKFVDVNGNNARRFVFDNTQKTMDVTVALNGEVINPAEGTLTFTYNGIQTNGKTYNSTTAPVHAGVYTVMAEYADYTEGGSLAHYGAAAGIMAIEPAASTMDVTGGTVTYDGESHTATVVATGSGVTEPDYTLISGGAYVSGDINEVGVDAFHGNVNIDFPAWLDKALAEHEFKTEGVDTAYLTDFISSYRDEALALIPVETLVKLGVAEEEINAYIAKLNGYIDELLAVLEKLPAGVALTFNDDVTYTETGYYFYYGIVTDSDHYPSTDTGLLVIEKKEILFDLLDTKVTWNGKGQMVDLNNPENADFVTVVIDRKNNTINIVLDEDAQYALNAVAKLLGVEFDGDVQMSTILDKYNGKEVADAIVKLIDEAQKLNLSEEIQKVLAAVKAELETLPTSGTITVNGELPTELGVYEVYAISYSQHFKTTAAEAELEIVPVRVEVILNEVSKVYGEEDPELTYTVKYYDHEGNEMTGVDANITVQISREAGEDVGTYDITGTVTLGDNTHFELIKQPVDSKFTITKATDNTWTEEPGIEGWTYGETAKTPVGEAKYGEIKVEYRSADDPDAPFTTTVPTDAGDYIVRFTVEDTDNYNGITVEKELTIAKAASKITEEPKAVENLVYDGENHALITAGVAEGGKLVYSLSENGPFSEEIPVGKEAGTYTVYYKVAGDNNHNDSEVKSITVKIKEDHTGEYPIPFDPEKDTTGTIKPGATVDIDGVPYTLDEDCIAWVKNTDAKIVTTYKYHEGNTVNETYPTNMYVWYLTAEDNDGDEKMDEYNAERIPELDNLFEYNGTSIRVGAAKNGIRFFTSMNPSTRTKLQSGTLINTSVLKGAKMVRAGTVFKKNPEVQVTLENGVSSDVYGGKAGSNFRVFGTYSGRNWFTGMLVGLDTDAETVTAGIAARPYAQLQIGDETVVIYGGQIQRSIYYVACQNQDTFAQGSAYDQFVEGLIAKGNSIRGEG